MKRRTLRLSAPRQPASAGCRFVALRRIARIFTMGPFARAGVFLARSGFRLREFRSGVNGPRLTLRSLTYRLIILVRPFDSATCAGLPQRQEASTPQNPVALLPVRSSGRASNLHSPSGVFGSLWIKAFDWLPDLPVHLPDLPDLRSLPAAVLSLVAAADHSSRSATFPEACCSSNLLEPSSLCNANLSRVNEFLKQSNSFQQILSLLFRTSYTRDS